MASAARERVQSLENERRVAREAAFGRLHAIIRWAVWNAMTRLDVI